MYFSLDQFLLHLATISVRSSCCSCGLNARTSSTTDARSPWAGSDRFRRNAATNRSSPIPPPGCQMTLLLRPYRARAYRPLVAASPQNRISIHQKAQVQCPWIQAAQAVQPSVARALRSVHNSHSAADAPDRHTPQRTRSHTRSQSYSGKTACLQIRETVSALPCGCILAAQACLQIRH